MLLWKNAGGKIPAKIICRMASDLRCLVMSCKRSWGANQRGSEVVNNLKQRMWLNLILGMWLMVSPFALVTVKHAILRNQWEDLLLGFGIATFSLCRLFSRKDDEIVFSDWLVTALGLLTLINPILYGYLKLKVAAWNNLSVGALVLLVSIYQDWRDGQPRTHSHRHSHP